MWRHEEGRRRRWKRLGGRVEGAVCDASITGGRGAEREQGRGAKRNAGRKGKRDGGGERENKGGRGVACEGGLVEGGRERENDRE